MKKIFIIIFYTLWALAIVSSIYNIKLELEVKQLVKQINEKDELIKEYQYGISQIEFFDECYIGDCDE